MKTTTPYLFKDHHSLTIGIPKLAPHQLSQACFRLDELVEASKSCTVHIQIFFADVFIFTYQEMLQLKLNIQNSRDKMIMY